MTNGVKVCIIWFNIIFILIKFEEPVINSYLAKYVEAAQIIYVDEAVAIQDMDFYHVYHTPNYLKLMGQKESLIGRRFREAVKPEHQAAFIQSIIDFMHKAEADAQTKGIQNKFAGVDVDWEPNGNLWTLPSTGADYVQVSKADLENYSSFLINLKQALTANGYSTLKTAMTASPAAIRNVDQIVPDYWRNLADNGVFLDMMTYDYNGQEFGSSCEYSGFNSPLWNDPANPCSDNKDFSISGSVETLLAENVPASQIGIGVPAYGRAYTINNVSDVTAENPYARYIAGNYILNPAVNDFHSTFTYREIITGRAFGGNSASENTVWTDIASPAQVGQTAAVAYVNYTTPAWISYTSKEDAAKVMSFAREKGLSGVMVWELDQDVQDGDTHTDGTPVDLNRYSIIAGLAGSNTHSRSHTLTVSEISGTVGIQVMGITNGVNQIGQLDYMGAGSSKTYTADTNPSVEAIDGSKTLVVSWTQWGALPAFTTCPGFDFNKNTRILINGQTKQCSVE